MTESVSLKGGNVVGVAAGVVVVSFGAVSCSSFSCSFLPCSEPL